MNPDSEAYRKKVRQFLDKMKPGQRYIVSEICEEENTEKFIAAVKEWMDAYPYQGGLSFNWDYSEFYMSWVVVS